MKLNKLDYFMLYVMYKKMGWSAIDLAELCGVSRQYVHRIINKVKRWSDDDLAVAKRAIINQLSDTLAVEGGAADDCDRLGDTL